MKHITRSSVDGSALVVSLSTVLVLSIVGAGVLANLTTRYNVSTSQVRAWKQALQAAEAAGDIGYTEVRKIVLEGPTQAFVGWTKSGQTYTSPAITIGPDNLVASVTVDLFDYDPVTGNPWYRIRAKGTAPVQGLKRAGMDDRMGPNTRGDSLLRKIDLQYDHFIAAYGPKGDGNGKAIVPVAYPQVTRRIELIASPITPFEAAIKARNNFYGLGSSAYIDSYDSKKGAYQFVANNPGHALFNDSQSGHVQIGTAVATVMGTIYGNLATDRGTVLRSPYVKGTVDNNVPFELEPFKMPTMPAAQPSPTTVSGTVNLTPPAAGTPAQPIFYLFSSFSSSAKLTINPAAGGAETYVAMRVTNNFEGELTVKEGVNVQVFFDGNMKVKARDIINETMKAGNVQFYGITPLSGTQTIDLDSGGGSGVGFHATIYAPGADYKMNGAPDITGALVCKTFYGNGNTTWHYDRQLDHLGEVVDYRITSYVEDIR